jgi:hypothetical protein
MPSALVANGEKKKIDAASIKKIKVKDKPTGAGTAVKKSSSSLSQKPLATPRTYPDLAPPERRQRILERVAQLALGLESQLNYRRIKRTAILPPGSNLASAKSGNDAKQATLEASYIPPEDPPLHTARMWEWLEIAGFFQATSTSESQSSKDARLGLQCPEINPRGLFLPTPTRILGQKEKGEEKNQQISSHGLFDRLQSLLVAEEEAENSGDLDNCDTDDDSETDSETDDDESLGFLDESDEDEQESSSPKTSRADLSDLTLEERTFLHLCSIGLIKKSTFPVVELDLDDEDDGMEDDMANVIGEMNADLSILTARNNARISYLETVMDPMNLAYRKQTEEEQASLITRCQSLLKRSKEKTRKSNKLKNAVAATKDDLDLPW